MIKNYLIFTLTSILTSCTTIYFSELQPREGVLLNKVPDELHGVWVNKLDTCWINAQGMIEKVTIFDSLDVRNSEIDYMYLSDTIKLVKSNELYVAHQFSENKWIITIIKKRKNGNLEFYAPLQEPFPKESKNLKITEIVYEPEVVHLYDENTLEYYIDTLDEINENQKISEIHYSGQMTYKQLKSIVRKENLFKIHGSDGNFQFVSM